MLGDDNQRGVSGRLYARGTLDGGGDGRVSLADMSPMYRYAHRLSALQTETIASIDDTNQRITDELDIERGRAVMATREATERRLRLQSDHLRRFHHQICLRVNERVLQQRALQQSRDKRIDAKLARLLQLPSAPDINGDSSASYTMTAPVPRSLHLSRTPHMESMLKTKRDQLKGYKATLSLVGAIVRSDAQARETLLVSTRVPRVRESRSCEADVLDEADENEGNQLNDGNGEHSERGDVALPSKQRVELYAAVRRRYMAMERERVQQRGRDLGVRSSDGKHTTKLLTKKGTSQSNIRPTGDERRIDAHVKIVDASKGCDANLQRQAARTSSTPWRNSPAQPLPSSSTSNPKATTHERFLTALQAQLGTPALCSCGGRMGRVECANNCEFYRQPKRKERAAASVCKQHETRA